MGLIIAEVSFDRKKETEEKWAYARLLGWVIIVIHSRKSSHTPQLQTQFTLRLSI